MHSLIITAHPSPNGLTHRLAAAYKEEREKAGHEATLVDLYASPWREEFLSFATMEDVTERQKRMTELQKLIKLAHEIVFVFPTWWYDVPAILKNLLDQQFTSGFAFRYSKRGITGLLTDKTYKVFSTSAGPGWVYRFGICPHAKSFNFALKECGLKREQYEVFGNRRSDGSELDQRGEAAALDVVRRSAREARVEGR